MNNQLRTLSVALLALGLSAPAFAEGSVSVPSQQGGFKIGVDALYLRATNSDLDYATVASFPVAGQQNARNAAVDQSYDWGFYAQIGYLFPCTGNDLTVGYTYLRSDETDSVVAPTGGVAVGLVQIPQLAATLAIVGVNPAVGKAEFDLNAVDLEAGQRFTTGAYDMRMFAGLRYASIDHTLRASGVQTPVAIPPLAGAMEYTSNFKGIGPRIGVDGRYCLQSGFGLDANLSTSLLVGNVDAKFNAVRTAGNVFILGYSANNGSRSRVVPVLEAKLGVDYTHIVDRCSKSSLVFEAGYQVTNYFNVVDHARVVNNFAIASQNTTSDVGFDGPYLGVKYYA